jgi:hypothetical protein
MAKEKPKIQSILESLFVNGVDMLEKADVGRLLSVLYVQLDMISGEIQVYDEHETLLGKNVIFDWADRCSERGVRSHKQPVNSLRVALSGLKSRKFFEKPIFTKPFSISLVDDNFCEIETIFTCGEKDMLSEGRLMKNLEQELQVFSKKLFADME